MVWNCSVYLLRKKKLHVNGPVRFKPVLSKGQLFKKFLVIVPYFTEFWTFLLNVLFYVLLKVKYRLPIKLYHILDFQDVSMYDIL